MSGGFIVTKIGYFDDKIMLWAIDKSYNGKISVFKNNNRGLIKALRNSGAGKIANGELDILVERLKNNELYRRYDENLQFIDFTGYNKAHLSFEWTTINGVDEYNITANVGGDSYYEYLDILGDCSIVAVRNICECKVLDLSHCKYLKRIEGISKGASCIYTNKIIFPYDLDIEMSRLTLDGKDNTSKIELVGNNKLTISDSLIEYTNISKGFKGLLLLSNSWLEECNINDTVTVTVNLDEMIKSKENEATTLYVNKISHCNIRELQLKVNNKFVKYNNVSELKMMYESYAVRFLDGKEIEEQLNYE